MKTKLTLRPAAATPPTREPERTVFVLSGGGGRGAAQVGMLTELLAAGVRPDALVGTSVGALNAAFLAVDPVLDQALDLADRWEQLKGRDIFPGSALSKAGHLIRRRPHLYDAAGLTHVIETWCPRRRLEDLAVPVRVVTTHLGTGTACYHDSGDLVRTLLASAALPALFSPVPMEDPATGAVSLHVDGGVSDLVPIAGAVSLRPTHVYVLDVTCAAPPLEKPRNPVEVLVASLAVAMRLRADVTFEPGVRVTHIRTEDIAPVRGGLMDFTRTTEFLEAGTAAARAALADNRADDRADPTGCPESGGRPLGVGAGRWRTRRTARRLVPAVPSGA